MKRNCLNQTYNGIEIKTVDVEVLPRDRLNQTYNGIEIAIYLQMHHYYLGLNQTYNGIEIVPLNSQFEPLRLFKSDL